MSRGVWSRAVWLGGAALVLVCTPALAESAPADLRGAIAGELEAIFDGANERMSELVELDDRLVPALLAAPLEQSIRVAAWPVAPGVREDLVLTRFDVYSPAARIYGFENGRLVEVQRSRLVFFQGRLEAGGQKVLLVTLDPDERSLRGFVDSASGRTEFRRVEGRSGNVYRVADAEVFLTPAERASQPAFVCGQEEIPAQPGRLFEPPGETADASAPNLPRITGNAIGSLHQATIAVDTDNEFFHRKWGVKTTAQYQANATNFLASLFAGMTVMYERDVLVRLLQGTTFLRTPPVADEGNYTSDPYSAVPKADGSASFAQLDEAHLYWAANYGGVARAATMMVSGKGNSSTYSGTAFIQGLCSAERGYSVAQFAILSSTAPLAGETSMAAHELGHIFGSPHTQCYTPPVDTCYSPTPAVAGCYSGPTSCPVATTINGVPGVTGTIMSYCHLLAGCTASLVFHPATVTLLQPLIQIAVNQCIFPVPVFGVAAVKPNNGPIAGGTPITITGTSFVAGGALAVSVGGVAATSVVRQSATTLTATTPAHATGAVSIAVINGDGLASPKTLTNSYFYSPPAAVSDFYSLTPCRVIDTRNADGPTGGPALATGIDRSFPMTGCGVPVNARAISANLTIVSPGATGVASVFAGNAMYFGTSEISFSAGVTRANNAVVELATDGTGTIKARNLAGVAVHFVLDVNGYFQ